MSVFSGVSSWKKEKSVFIMIVFLTFGEDFLCCEHSWIFITTSRYVLNFFIPFFSHCVHGFENVCLQNDFFFLEMLCFSRYSKSSIFWY